MTEHTRQKPPDSESIYRSFLSYSHADSDVVRDLHRRMEGFQLPSDLAQVAGIRRPLSPAFRDRDDLAAAPALQDEIERALAGSASLVVACSPDAAKSKYVDLEVETFLQRHGARPVFPVLLRGDPDDPPLPPALRSPSHGRDWHGCLLDARTPLAARSAVIEMAGVLSGQPATVLRARDAARRRRRFGVGATMLGVVIAGLVAVGAFALRRAADARESASQERAAMNRATELRAVEARTKEQAEDVLSFMLEDLQVNVMETRRIDLLADVATACVAYYEERQPETTPARKRQIKALGVVGAMANFAGASDDALRALSQAMALSDAIPAAERDSEVVKVDSMLRTMAASLQQGQRPSSQAIPSHGDPLSDVDSVRSHSLATAEALQAAVMNPAADRPDIVRRSTKLIEVLDAIPEEECTNEHVLALASAHLARAFAHMVDDRPKQASSDFETSLSHHYAVRENTGSAFSMLLDIQLAKAHLMLAETLEDLEAPMKDRQRHVGSAVDLLQALLKDDANNAAAETLLGGALHVESGMLKDAGERDAAAEKLDAAIDVYVGLVDRGVSDFSRVTVLVDALRDRHRLHRDKKEWAESIRCCERAIALLKRLASGLHADRALREMAKRHRDIAKSYRGLGNDDTAFDADLKALAIHARRQARDQAKDLFKDIHAQVRSVYGWRIGRVAPEQALREMKQLEDAAGESPAAKLAMWTQWRSLATRLQWKLRVPRLAVPARRRAVDLGRLLVERGDVRATGVVDDMISLVYCYSADKQYDEGLQVVLACRTYVSEQLHVPALRLEHRARTWSEEARIRGLVKMPGEEKASQQALAIATQAAELPDPNARVIRPLLNASRAYAFRHIAHERFDEASEALEAGLEGLRAFHKRGAARGAFGVKTQNVLRLVGELATRHKWAVGPRAYEARIRALDRAVAKEKRDAAFARRMATYVADWGEACMKAGDTTTALLAWQRLDELVAQHAPAKDRWWLDKRRQLRERRGDIAKATDPKKALVHYRAATADRVQLAATVKGNRIETRGLSVMHHKTALLLRDHLDDPRGALEAFESALAFANKTVAEMGAKGPKDSWWARNRSTYTAEIQKLREQLSSPAKGDGK